MTYKLTAQDVLHTELFKGFVFPLRRLEQQLSRRQQKNIFVIISFLKRFNLYIICMHLNISSNVWFTSGST